MLVHYHFHCKTANLHKPTQMLVHYHFHCKTANLHSWQHKCSFIITSIVRLLSYTADNTNAHYHSLWQHRNASLSLLLYETANLHSWQHKCSFIITSIVRLLTYTADKTNAHSLSLPLEDCYLTQLTTQMLVHYHFHCKTANLHSWQHKCSFIITSIVRLLTYTADNTNARSLSLPL